MAYKTETVPNKVAVSYHGITVYHTHRYDNIYNPTNPFIFTTDPFGSEKDIGKSANVFDYRRIPTYNSELTAEGNLLLAIRQGFLVNPDMPKADIFKIQYLNGENVEEYHCPVCGLYLSPNNEKIWGENRLTGDDDYYECDCTCPRCGAVLKQTYRLFFDGFEVQ